MTNKEYVSMRDALLQKQAPYIVMDKNELIVKVANTSNTAQSISLNFAGLKKQDVLSNGRCIKLRSLDLDKDNTLEQPFAITPQETAVSVEGHVFTTEQEPNTFAVYKFTKK